MIFISHRGNINQKIVERENTPDYIEEALSSGYDCEIDVWSIDNQLFLGHDSPDTKIDISFLEKYKAKLWIHCKNLNALDKLNVDFNCFFHDKDVYTITSKGHIWGNINSKLTSNVICVMPEMYSNNSINILQSCKGICSDKISYYQREFYRYKRICILDSYFDYILNFTKDISFLQVHNEFEFDEHMLYDVVYINKEKLLTSNYVLKNQKNIKKLCIRENIGEEVVPPDFFEKDFCDSIDNYTITHYINKQYINDVTFVIQGNYDFRQIKNQHVIYCIFGNVRLSTWKNYDLESVKLYITKNNCCNSQNIYFQMYTTYNGVKLIDSQYTIKTRSDEFYSDWNYFIEKMRDNPNKIICNNLFFRKDHRKLHISDHILGGTTKLLTSITAKCLENLKDKRCMPSKNKRLLWIAPETWITTSHLELLYDYDSVYNNKGDTKKMILDNYIIIDIEKIGYYYAMFQHENRKHVLVRGNKEKVMSLRNDIIEVDDISELQKKHVYILANNHLLDTHHVEKLPLLDDDICFIFNYMYHSLTILNKLEHKNTYVFLRYVADIDRHHVNNNYFLGQSEFLSYQENFYKLITVCDEQENIPQEFIDNINIENENINYDLVKNPNINYPLNEICTPTSGFLSYLYAKYKFPDREIILVGFTGHLPDGNQDINKRHNYKWEQEYYKKNGVKNIWLR